MVGWLWAVAGVPRGEGSSCWRKWSKATSLKLLVSVLGSVLLASWLPEPILSFLSQVELGFTYYS